MKNGFTYWYLLSFHFLCLFLSRFLRRTNVVVDERILYERFMYILKKFQAESHFYTMKKFFKISASVPNKNSMEEEERKKLWQITRNVVNVFREKSYPMHGFLLSCWVTSRLKKLFLLVQSSPKVFFLTTRFI